MRQHPLRTVRGKPSCLAAATVLTCVGALLAAGQVPAEAA